MYQEENIPLVAGTVTTSRTKKEREGLETTRIHHLEYCDLKECIDTIRESNPNQMIVGYKYSMLKKRVTFFTKKEDGVLDTRKWHQEHMPKIGIRYDQSAFLKHLDYVSTMEVSEKDEISLAEIETRMTQKFQAMKRYTQTWEDMVNQACGEIEWKENHWNQYKKIEVGDIVYDQNNEPVYTLKIKSVCGREVIVYVKRNPEYETEKRIMITGAYTNVRGKGKHQSTNIEEDLLPLKGYLNDYLQVLYHHYEQNIDFFKKYQYYNVSGSAFHISFNERYMEIWDQHIDPGFVSTRRYYSKNRIARVEYDCKNSVVKDQFEKKMPKLKQALRIPVEKLPLFLREEIEKEKDVELEHSYVKRV